jgi:hypothetical protein
MRQASQQLPGPLLLQPRPQQQQWLLTVML